MMYRLLNLIENRDMIDISRFIGENITGRQRSMFVEDMEANWGSLAREIGDR